jgi:stress-induced morphogen
LELFVLLRGRKFKRWLAKTCFNYVLSLFTFSPAKYRHTLKIKGAYDDPNGSHISIEVISDKFEGKRPVQCQQLVYKALWEELQGPVHAVDSMICKTPAEK